MSPLVMLIGTFTPVSSDQRVENGSGRKERAKMGTKKEEDHLTVDLKRVTKSQRQHLDFKESSKSNFLAYQTK